MRSPKYNYEKPTGNYSFNYPIKIDNYEVQLWEYLGNYGKHFTITDLIYKN